MTQETLAHRRGPKRGAAKEGEWWHAETDAREHEPTETTLQKVEDKGSAVKVMPRKKAEMQKEARDFRKRMHSLLFHCLGRPSPAMF
jgi:hypothetical protein